MGHNHGAVQGVFGMVGPVQALLKQCGLKISRRTIITILTDIDKAASWFAVSGDLNLPSWEKLGLDLERAKQEGKLGCGTFPFWRLVRGCLQEGANTEIIKEG